MMTKDALLRLLSVTGNRLRDRLNRRARRLTGCDRVDFQYASGLVDFDTRMGDCG